jgi:hypothetical protein
VIFCEPSGRRGLATCCCKDGIISQFNRSTHNRPRIYMMGNNSAGHSTVSRLLLLMLSS